MTDDADLTALLLAWSDGDEAAESRLIDAVYDELRRVARRDLGGERDDHSLAPTALVHETYLKLVDQRRVRWQNRALFFGIAEHLMRRILVDHARGRARRPNAARTGRLYSMRWTSRRRRSTWTFSHSMQHSISSLPWMRDRASSSSSDSSLD